MMLSKKIIGMVIVSFLVVLFLLSSISIVSLWNIQKKNIQLFKEEFLEQGRELLDADTALFFNQIEYNSEHNNINNNSTNVTYDSLANTDFSKKEILEYLHEIDPNEKNTLVIDIQNQSYIYSPSNSQLKEILPEGIISQLISDHILNNKDNFDIDNFQKFQEDNSNTVVPGRIVFKVYEDSGLIIGYGRTFDSGKVRIEFIERQNLQALWKFIITAVLLFLIIVSIVVAVTIILLKYFILTPLGNITLGIRELKDGKLNTQLSIARKDEIGELAVVFNQMTKELKKSAEKLENYNKDLEKKVGDRTSELEKRDTQLVLINKRLEEANVKLKGLDMQKDEFISLVAHELKTPLTSIQGFAQVLLEKDLWGDSENKHYLEMIAKNTDRLYTLVTDIVDSSRINLGKLKFNIDVYDVYKIFNDVKEDMSLTISKKGFTPEFVIEDRLPNVKADFERTMQVLHNLISNSIKFTIKGTISLHVIREGEFIKFIVKDTGQGIPDENKSALFSRFYQVDSELTRKVGGSGLGLSICKGLVEGMGGKIGFESESGKGSTFYFTLPIADIKNA